MIQYFPIVTGSLTVLGNINVSGSITTSGSITISGSITSASFATSASNATNAISASYANNLTVAGTLTAQTIVVQTITSSVDYITGSSINGSKITDTHQFTGSVGISGSLTGIGATFSGKLTVNNASSTSSLLVYGGNSIDPRTDSAAGEIRIGNNASYYGNIAYSNGGSTQLTIDNSYDNAAASMVFRMRTLGTPINALTILGTGAATFSNTETTFNYNPQSGSLLSGYNYLNFGGGSIMYRNTTDIYIGSNAKYGSAGTTVACYTSANGMGMLTMDGGTFNFQATTGSVTANTAYGMPIRMTITSAGNVGIGTNSPGSILHVKGGTAGGADFGAELRVWENSFGAVLQGFTYGTTGAFLGNFRYNINTPASSVTNYLSAGHGILFLDGVRIFSSTPGGTSGGTFTPVERMKISADGNFDYGGFAVLSTNNPTYRQAFYGGLSIMWRNASDWYLNSNHTFGSSNTNIASYTNAEGIGRFGCSGGGIEWDTYAGAVTAGTAYTMTARFTITKDGNIGMPTTYGFTTSNAANLYIDSGAGYLYRSTSSSKYKTDIRDYDKGLAKVMQIRPVYYKGIGEHDKNKQFAGLIAEEIHDLGLSEFVQYAEDDSPDALAYSHMVALLTKSIQELNTKFEEYKATHP